MLRADKHHYISICIENWGWRVKEQHSLLCLELLRDGLILRFFSYSKGLTRLKCLTNCMLILLFSSTSCGHTEEKKSCVPLPLIVQFVEFLISKKRIVMLKLTKKIILYRILCAFQNKGACYWHATVFGLKRDEFHLVCFWLINTQVTTTMAAAVATVRGYCSTDPIKLSQKNRFQHYHHAQIDTKMRGEK